RPSWMMRVQSRSALSSRETAESCVRSWAASVPSPPDPSDTVGSWCRAAGYGIVGEVGGSGAAVLPSWSRREGEAMPKQRVMDRLHAGEVLLMDGGTGSELQRRGVEVLLGSRGDKLGPWSATANLDAPDVVQQVHQDRSEERRGGKECRS